MATLRGELRAHVRPFYWTVRTMPAFARLPHGAALRAWLPYSLRALRHWQLWASLIGLPLVSAAVGLAVGWHLVGRVPGDSFDVLTLATGLAAAAGGGLAGNYWAAVTNRLALADQPHLCRACGYDLSATPVRCPECGVVPGAS